MSLRISPQSLIDRAVEISTDRDISLARAMSIAQTEIDAQVQVLMTRIKARASKRVDDCAKAGSVREARRLLTETGRRLRRRAA